jgi:hypothetical protein
VLGSLIVTSRAISAFLTGLNLEIFMYFYSNGLF